MTHKQQINPYLSTNGVVCLLGVLPGFAFVDGLSIGFSACLSICLCGVLCLLGVLELPTILSICGLRSGGLQASVVGPAGPFNGLGPAAPPPVDMTIMPQLRHWQWVRDEIVELTIASIMLIDCYKHMHATKHDNTVNTGSILLELWIRDHNNICSYKTCAQCMQCLWI